MARRAVRAILFVAVGFLLTTALAVAENGRVDNGCEFILGFRVLRDEVNRSTGSDKVGSCLEQVHYNAAGNAFQATDSGLMYWRKGDNWTGFTDGYRTWISGPYGLELRLNTERYRWELSTTPTQGPEWKVDLTGHFLTAVRDAEDAKQDEISTSLTAITEKNGSLVWRGDPGKKQLLAVTWTSNPWYRGSKGRSTTPPMEIWITPVPQVTEFCETHTFREPTLRLEQLLGLPVASGKQWFVEMWVNPQDIFRPAANPDVTTPATQLDFPSSVSEQYKTWFNDLRARSYGENGYPWTRLGYTYDWGKTQDHMGLSEFVVKSGSAIEVKSLTSTEEYCR